MYSICIATATAMLTKTDKLYTMYCITLSKFSDRSLNFKQLGLQLTTYLDVGGGGVTIQVMAWAV